MKKASFVFYADWWDIIKNLPIDVQGDVLIDIVKYGLTGEKSKQPNQIVKAILAMIKKQIDINNKRADNGKFGGAPKGNINAQKTTKIQPKNNQNSTKNNQNSTKNNQTEQVVNEEDITIFEEKMPEKAEIEEQKEKEIKEKKEDFLQKKKENIKEKNKDDRIFLSDFSVITAAEFRDWLVRNEESFQVNENLRRGLFLGNDFERLAALADDYVRVQQAVGNDTNTLKEYRFHFFYWAQRKLTTVKRNPNEQRDEELPLYLRKSL